MSYWEWLKLVALSLVISIAITAFAAMLWWWLIT